MKVAILTLINQLNYGGILQAYALQKACLKMGIHADLVNYWLSPHNRNLTGEVFSIRFPRFLKDLLKGKKPWNMEIRRYRTKQFLKKSIQFSEKTYRNSSELANIKEYDLIIVGSDQVWNYKWHGDPNPFLLTKLDPKIIRTAYAASMGFKELPEEYLETYRAGISQFKLIGVRESEGVKQVKSWTGLDAECVLDPVLLLDKEDWQELVSPYQGKSYIFCYWLGNLTQDMINQLTTLACDKQQMIHLFTNSGTQVLTYNKSLIKVIQNAGPQEFLSAIANSQGVLSDSFHAMLFATIFEKDMQIIGESHTDRKCMISRFENFTSQYFRSLVYQNNVPNKFLLASFDFNQVVFNHAKQMSLQFLMKIKHLYQ